MFRRRNLKFNYVENSGFGTNAKTGSQVLFDKNGVPNVTKVGLPWYRKISLYHFLTNLKISQFLGLIVLYYFIANVFFGFLYFINGVENLNIISVNPIRDYWESFFFSAQTLTSVGYGGMFPKNIPANIVASIESLFGLVTFALITGLIYGRFSRPKVFLEFSKNMLIAPYKEGKGLMFRMAPYKTINDLVDAEVSMLMLFKEDEIFKFVTLDIDMPKIKTLTLNWTLVHPLNEDSPLWGMTIEEMKNISATFIIYLKVRDEFFTSEINIRREYEVNTIVENAKFVSMYHRNDKTLKTELDISKINDFEKL